MNSTHRQNLARWGEALAAETLTRQGYQVIARNVRTPHGELDLVTRQASTTVFVEVKTRASTSFGLPEEAVTRTKQAHLLASAQHYLQNHPTLDGDWRIDVIAIRRLPDQPPEIVHFKSVIREQ
jgi:putative endonuclease